MSLSYLETSLDRIDAAARDDVIEICINPDGTCWGEFQGDHFMRALDQRLTGVQVRDLGNQIASSANTTMSKDRPIVSVSITYKGRPIRAQVITPPAVLSAMSISLRFFSSLPLDGIALDFLYGKERKLEDHAACRNSPTCRAAPRDRSTKDRVPDDLCRHDPVHREFHRRDHPGRSP